MRVGDRTNQGVLPTASSHSARLFPSHCFLMSCCRLAYSYCIVRSRCQLPCRRGCFRCALLLFCMRLCHCYRRDNGAGDASWIDIYHFYKQKREIFSQNILQSHDKAVPLQPLLKKSFDHCNDSYGRLAQLVQSVCLTSRGSGVRIPQRPPGVSPVVPQGIAGEFVFR